MKTVRPPYHGAIIELLSLLSAAPDATSGAASPVEPAWPSVIAAPAVFDATSLPPPLPTANPAVPNTSALAATAATGHQVPHPRRDLAAASSSA